MKTKIDRSEKARLTDRIITLEKRSARFGVEIAKAILRLHELFSESEGTKFFLRYCKTNFGYGRSHVYRLIRLAETPSLWDLDIEISKKFLLSNLGHDLLKAFLRRHKRRLKAMSVRELTEKVKRELRQPNRYDPDPKVSTEVVPIIPVANSLRICGNDTPVWSVDSEIESITVEFMNCFRELKATSAFEDLPQALRSELVEWIDTGIKKAC